MGRHVIIYGNHITMNANKLFISSNDVIILILFRCILFPTRSSTFQNFLMEGMISDGNIDSRKN